MSTNIVSLPPIEGQEESRPSPRLRAPGILGILKRHKKFVGPGVVASVTFYDPGNWATDLQAGSMFGNSHLFVLLIAITFAVFLQVLATRLGYISGKDLSQNCRIALYARPTRTKLWRWFALYPLWLLLEIGILFADIGELLGSAIAYNLLIPALPLWGGVLLTFLDVFLALIFFRGGKESKKSMKIFEMVITVVVMAVVIAALILLFEVKPDWALALRGFLPNLEIAQGRGFYTAIGIIGATIGPHAIILGSNLATFEREDGVESQSIETVETEERDIKVADNSLQEQPSRLNSWPILNQVDYGSVQLMATKISMGPEAKSRSIVSARSYLAHATFDIAASLFTLPLIVNAAILVVASTTFYYAAQADSTAEKLEADIEAVYGLLKVKLGPALAFLFAFALIISGQAASLTITMAGQSLSAGFLRWETNPLLRRLVTRTVGIIPSAVIAVIFGKDGINGMLIASQVAISIVLPFAIIPLAYFTGQEDVMSIDCVDDEKIHDPRPTFQTDRAIVRFKTDSLTIEPQKPLQGLTQLQTYYKNSGGRTGEKPVIRRLDTTSSGDLALTMFGRDQRSRLCSFANNVFVKVVVGSVVIVITSANIYAITQASQGGT